MCEFISWIEVTRGGKKEVLYLDDELVAEKRSKRILEGSKDNDFLGHHAIRAVWGLKDNAGTEGEVPDFWNADKLPEVLRSKLQDFSTLKRHFGKMLEDFAQKDDMEYIIKNASKDEKWKGLKEFCEQTLKASLLRGVTTETLKITVRYDLSIDELVKAAKLNGNVNPDVNGRNFKEEKRPQKKVEAVLVCLNRYASTEQVEAVIKDLHLRPGIVKELLSFSVDHPKKQTEFPIVELGSGWRDPYGDRGVAFLSRWSGRRHLSLGWRGDDWDEFYRFLAFSEV